MLHENLLELFRSVFFNTCQSSYFLGGLNKMIYVTYQKYLPMIADANCVDADQTAPLGAV